MSRCLPVFLVTSLLGLSLAAQDLSIELDTGGEAWVRKDAAIALIPSRWPEAGEGRLAVLIGRTDSTDIFRREADRLIYRSELVSLPGGETEISVFLVDSIGSWREIARMPLQVLRRGGIERLQIQQSVDLEIRGSHDPGDPPEVEETTDGEGSGQANFGLSASRSGWEMGVTAGLIGATEQEQALRFGDEGESAPRVDLSSYQIYARRGRGVVELGHVMFGASRQLIEGFNSRGLNLGLALGSRVELGLATLNGTQIAGWDNFFGLSENDHRVYAGSLGVELLEQPGALKLSGTVIDASILPLSDFNQGFLEDREESSGWSANLEASTPGGRIRFVGGFARSTFDNPQDPFLSQDADLVAVEEETRDARFADLDFVLYQGAVRNETWSTSLSLGFRHQRVDPLYRSIGAWVTPDIEENRAELNAMLGPMTGQASYRQSKDNLDEIPSVLKTKTRESNAAFYLPLSQTIPKEGGEERGWLPVLSYSYGRTHQFGDAIPENGGFSPGHIPDQVSLSHQASLDWQGNRWRFGYRLGLSDQDNRQSGRENDDFEGANHALSFGLSPHHTFDLSLDFSDEALDNIALAETDQAQRYGFQLNWRWTERMTFEAMGSRSENENDPKTRESKSDDFNLQWSWRFERMGEKHGFSGQFHILYTRQQIESVDLVFDFSDRVEIWRLTSGLSFSFH